MPYDITKVDTSSFTPAQMTAFNYAKSLIPDTNLAPQGAASPLYNPTAASGTVGSLAPTPKPVPLLSSATGADIVNENKTTLGNIEQSITIPQGATLTGLANKYGTSVQEILKQNPNITDPDVIQAGASLRLPLSVSGSPASSKMAADINSATQQGGMTADERTGLQNLQSQADAATTAAAKARAALDAKDYSSMDYWTAKATEDRQTYEKQLSDYYEQTKALRQRMTENLSPSEKEQQLAQQVIDIRSQAEAFKLQTEEDKFNEYQGQTMGFAGGRASEIDIRASFKNQELALKEKNLLLSLGLEQDARKMEGESIEAQLGYLADDFELQQKVQDKITASEEKVFEMANTLQKEQKDTLIQMLDGMQGVDPTTLSTQTRKQLEDMAARAGIPFSPPQTALKTQHDKQVFDESMKRATEARLGSGGSGGLTPSQINSTVNAVAGAFDNEPIVKAYNTVQEGYQTINSIGVNTKSPADDIAFIYAFAKIMDPNSVVREGEYNTIQKYAQTWADNFQFSAKRIFSNTNFLTPDAKQKMLNALAPKIQTITSQYKNLQAEYQRQVNDAYQGKPRQITNYSVPVTDISGNLPKDGDTKTYNGAEYVYNGSGWVKKTAQSNIINWNALTIK